MARKIGDRVGMMTIISREGYKEYPSGKVILYKCLCDCGNEVIKTTSNLSTQKSCGCLKTKREDFTGRKVGKLAVQSKVSSEGKFDTWLCRCDCGNEVTKTSVYLRVYKGSCGCDNPRNTTHKHTVDRKHSPEYSVWNSMVGRCERPNTDAYEMYGKRGISVCDRWSPTKGGSFENFLEDMGERPEGFTLDRIDNNGNYEKDNCRWTTISVQGFNQSRRVTNKSGRTGVHWNKQLGKWESYITKDRNKIGLGYYSLFEEAVKARECAELKYFGWVKEITDREGQWKNMKL